MALGGADTGALEPMLVRHGTPPGHLVLAEELVSQVTVDENIWETPTEVAFGPNDWRAQAKCSGLVTRVVEAAYGVDLQDRWDCDTTVPLAWHWHARIVDPAYEDPRFVQVDSAWDAMPGDILAISYSNCDAELLTCGHENGACGGKSTGHVAILTGTPVYTGTRWGLQQLDVPVVDAARSGHTEGVDTRWDETTESWREGTGRGLLRLLVSLEDGEIEAWAWSASEGSRWRWNNDEQVALGRWLSVLP